MSLKIWHWVGEMAQQVETHATKPDDLSSVLGDYEVEGENCPLTLYIRCITHAQLLPNKQM